jgi:hypothetical protein
MSDAMTTAAGPKDELPSVAASASQAPEVYPRAPLQLSLGLGLVALADWLFYGHAVGISAALLLVTLAAAAVLANPLHATKRDALLACGILVACVVPLILDVNVFSVLFGALGTACFALTMTRAGADWTTRCRDSAVLLLDGSWQAFADIFGATHAWASGDKTSYRLGRLTIWAMPLALGAVFALLFVSANPVIEEWITAFFHGGASQISIPRIGFWLLALSLAWPFVFMRAESLLGERAEAEVRAFAAVNADAAARANTQAAADAGPPKLLFSEGAILRALIVFNALFAVQTALDIAYLWGGAALPDGMTYATYAHRGAYPLIVTALLAAAFVLATMRPGSDMERSQLFRPLVFLWIGQNVLLVISSILRLDLYVQVYALSYWRVAAFIWMLLVAVGLVLIVARIALGRSNSWLTAMNLGSLAIALYACCFVNFAALIADYNVTHSRDMKGTGIMLDLGYLVSLGPQALPAIDRYLDHRKPVSTWWFTGKRNMLAAMHRDGSRGWRSWTWRNRQLTQYLKRAGDTRVWQSPDGSPVRPPDPGP